MRQLVQGYQVLSRGMGRVAFGGGQVADVVSDRDLVYDFPTAQLPLGHSAFHKQAGVGKALVIKLGVQRAQADLDVRRLDLLIR